MGLAFLVPGVVSPDLPIVSAQPAAFGDLATSFLALLAVAALRSRLGIVLVWAFNLLGSADLLHAFYEGNRTSIRLDPGLQGAAYFIPTVLVPLLLITHGLVFRLLLRKDTAARPAWEQPCGVVAIGADEARHTWAGATAFISYALGLWPNTIWYGRAWTTSLKANRDGLIYALLTGGVFGGP